MSLLALQFKFSSDVAKLLQEAERLGYGVTLGEALRTQAQANADAACGAGIEHSLHLEKLAIDINLFKAVNGEFVYITDGEGHRELGAFWKTMSASHRWGGDFPKKDFNHYSISPDGVRG